MVASFFINFSLGVIYISIYRYIKVQLRDVIDPPSVAWSNVSVISDAHRKLAPTSISNVNAAAKSPISFQNLKKVSLMKLTLGGVIFAVFVSYYALLESTCANTDPNEGAGELVITTVGGSATTWVGARFPAPLYVNAGAKLSPNGTEEGELLWIEDLCDGVLDCSSCPFVIDHRFNVSTLRGKILPYDVNAREALYMCGYNRLGRTLGQTGLIGLGTASTDQGRFDTAGFTPKIYRVGESRDSKARYGDAGIPFPQFHSAEHTSSQFMNQVMVGEGATVRAVVTPTAPNPWRRKFCGFWKFVSTLLMLGHVTVAEQAISNLIGHVRTSGLRLDLAQLALATEAAAHLILAVLQHDPFFSFHWAVLPVGGFAAFVFGPIVLSCSSTLLLAAFWCEKPNLLDLIKKIYLK